MTTFFISTVRTTTASPPRPALLCHNAPSRRRRPPRGEAVKRFSQTTVNFRQSETKAGFSRPFASSSAGVAAGQNDCFGEGFRTPAPCGTVVRVVGPAFESLPRRKPRAGRGAVWSGATYGDFRIADGWCVSGRGRWRAILAAETMMTSAFGREDGRAWRGYGGRRRTDDLMRTSACCSGARVGAKAIGGSRWEAQR